MANDLENFLTDYIVLLREKADEASLKARNEDGFQQGRHFGLYEALSLLKQQGIAFGLDLESLGIGSFDPDCDLFRP